MAELERIDLLIRAQVWRARYLQGEDPEFRGLYISEADLERLLARPEGLPQWATEPAPVSGAELRAALARIAEEIEKRTADTIAQGGVLRLERLVQRFGLDAFDRDVLLICLAPEMDLRYEQLYAYLQDDVTKKRPTIDLVLNLLSASYAEKLDQRRRLLPSAPLRRHRLIELRQGANEVFLAGSLRVDERITNYLLQDAEAEVEGRQEEIAAPLAPYVRLILHTVSFSGVALPATLKAQIVALCEAAVLEERSLAIGVFGPYGSGKRALAEAICTELGLRLLWVDVQSMAALDEPMFAELAGLVIREARLCDAVVMWAGFDVLAANDASNKARILLGELEKRPGISVLASRERWKPVDGVRALPFVQIEMVAPAYADRLWLWERAVTAGRGFVAEPEELDLPALANKFRFTGGEIEDAVATAANMARLRDPGRPCLTAEDLNLAGRLHSNQRLGALAQKIVPHHRWDDIVLPADRMRQLREICDQVKYRAQVYELWGFGDKLSLGKGVSALFAGSPGTGKTMSAEIIAGELGLDLYKIDLSSVVSKYIGETEKNLSRIFAEAETSNAILFFDEADALFSKRSEVRDAHDRYANIETGYLLQRMEAYEGVVILATNFARNLDDAFVRRLQFIVEFPFPSERERREIWQRIWPQATPCDVALDLDFAARELKIAGGNIRNIAVAATFLAAADGQVVTMEHLIHATRREFQKMGRVVVPDEFGHYAEYARPK